LTTGIVSPIDSGHAAQANWCSNLIAGRMNTSNLELRWRVRSGGGGRTERRYLDFVVDGTSLYDRLGVGDQVTALGCWPVEAEREYIRQLLSPSGRVPLYVCAECGDLGCGAITTVVEWTPDGVVWRDFAFENNYDATMTDTDSYRAVGPFVFNKTEYWRVLNERATSLSAS
jgi:hypothetical protein